MAQHDTYNAIESTAGTKRRDKSGTDVFRKGGGKPGSERAYERRLRQVEQKEKEKWDGETLDQRASRLLPPEDSFNVHPTTSLGKYVYVKAHKREGANPTKLVVTKEIEKNIKARLEEGGHDVNALKEAFAKVRNDEKGGVPDGIRFMFTTEKALRDENIRESVEKLVDRDVREMQLEIRKIDARATYADYHDRVKPDILAKLAQLELDMDQRSKAHSALSWNQFEHHQLKDPTKEKQNLRSQLAWLKDAKEDFEDRSKYEKLLRQEPVQKVQLDVELKQVAIRKLELSCMGDPLHDANLIQAKGELQDLKDKLGAMQVMSQRAPERYDPTMRPTDMTDAQHNLLIEHKKHEREKLSETGRLNDKIRVIEDKLSAIESEIKIYKETKDQNIKSEPKGLDITEKALPVFDAINKDSTSVKDRVTFFHSIEERKAKTKEIRQARSEDDPRIKLIDTVLEQRSFRQRFDEDKYITTRAEELLLGKKKEHKLLDESTIETYRADVQPIIDAHVKAAMEGTKLSKAKELIYRTFDRKSWKKALEVIRHDTGKKVDSIEKAVYEHEHAGTVKRLEEYQDKHKDEHEDIKKKIDTLNKILNTIDKDTYVAGKYRRDLDPKLLQELHEQNPRLRENRENIEGQLYAEDRAKLEFARAHLLQRDAELEKPLLQDQLYADRLKTKIEAIDGKEQNPKREDDIEMLRGKLESLNTQHKDAQVVIDTHDRTMGKIPTEKREKEAFDLVEEWGKLEKLRDIRQEVAKNAQEILDLAKAHDPKSPEFIIKNTDLLLTNMRLAREEKQHKLESAVSPDDKTQLRLEWHHLHVAQTNEIDKLLDDHEKRINDIAKLRPSEEMKKESDALKAARFELDIDRKELTMEHAPDVTSTNKRRKDRLRGDLQPLFDKRLDRYNQEYKEIKSDAPDAKDRQNKVFAKIVKLSEQQIALVDERITYNKAQPETTQSLLELSRLNTRKKMYEASIAAIEARKDPESKSKLQKSQQEDEHIHTLLMEQQVHEIANAPTREERNNQYTNLDKLLKKSQGQLHTLDSKEHLSEEEISQKAALVKKVDTWQLELAVQRKEVLRKERAELHVERVDSVYEDSHYVATRLRPSEKTFEIEQAQMKNELEQIRTDQYHNEKMLAQLQRQKVNDSNHDASGAEASKIIAEGQRLEIDRKFQINKMADAKIARLDQEIKDLDAVVAKTLDAHRLLGKSSTLGDTLLELKIKATKQEIQLLDQKILKASVSPPTQGEETEQELRVKRAVIYGEYYKDKKSLIERTVQDLKERHDQDSKLSLSQLKPITELLELPVVQIMKDKGMNEETRNAFLNLRKNELEVEISNHQSKFHKGEAELLTQELKDLSFGQEKTNLPELEPEKTGQENPTLHDLESKQTTEFTDWLTRQADEAKKQQTSVLSQQNQQAAQKLELEKALGVAKIKILSKNIILTRFNSYGFYKTLNDITKDLNTWAEANKIQTKK